MHHLTLITTLAVGLSVSLILGYLTKRLGMSPILGYLLAGIAVGPQTPGFVADRELASQLAEIGVILLMFGVGLHFKVKDLLAVKSIAIPGAVGQSLVATLLGTMVGLIFGWGWVGGVILGISISVASTVVLIRGLEDRNALSNPEGHIAVGWLIVEDIFTVLVLVLLPIVTLSLRGGGGGPGAILGTMGLAILKLAVMAGVVLLVGGKVIPWLLGQVARTRSQELFTLAVLTIALAIAIGSAYFFGASMALGAFLAGMVVGQSALSHQAAANAIPMRDAFAVIFFVSVGMLFDPRILISNTGLVFSVLGIILFAKPIAAFLIVIVLGYSLRAALTVAVALGQIGEFSFIVGDLARQLGFFPQGGNSVLVFAALISIAVNPLLFRGTDWLEGWLRRRPKLWGLMNRRAEGRGKKRNLLAAARLAEMEPTGVRAIVVGYGPVGKTLARILEGFGIHPVIVDLNIDTVTRLSEEGHSAIFGDAGNPDILKAAGIDRAKYLVITLPDLLGRIPVIVAARDLSEDLVILSRARYLAERSALEEFGVTEVCYEEAEAAVGLSELLLRAEGAEEETVEKETNRIRWEFALHRAQNNAD